MVKKGVLKVVPNKGVANGKTKDIKKIKEEVKK